MTTSASKMQEMETPRVTVIPTTNEQTPSSLSSATYTNELDNDPKQKPKGTFKRDTHFLCFPLVTQSSIPQLHKSLSHFRDISTTIPFRNQTEKSSTSKTDSDVNSEFNTDLNPNSNMEKDSNTTSNLRIIPEKAHRPPGTFHLTLGVMDLSSKPQYEKAMNLLQNFDVSKLFSELSSSSSSSSSLSELEPLQISLHSLSSFPSSSRARVLYALPLDSTNRLQEFAIRIRQKWRQEGLILEGRPLVLHATVANLRYAAKSKGPRGGKKNGSKRKSKDEDGEVDARGLIEVFDRYAGRLVKEKDSLGRDDQGKGEEEEKEREKSKGKFIWAQNIPVNKLAICKLGAVKSEDEIWGLEYPPVALRSF